MKTMREHEAALRHLLDVKSRVKKTKQQAVNFPAASRMDSPEDA